MLKKQGNAVGAQPEFASKQMPESLDTEGEALIKAYLAEKGRSAVGLQKVFTEDHDQPSQPATMATYTEAVNEFTKNATAFIEQIPLFTKARDSYEQAMRASAELRSVLDAGDESLRTLMAQFEQAVNNRVEKAAFDKKKPELVKVDAAKAESRTLAVNELPHAKWSDLP